MAVCEIEGRTLVAYLSDPCAVHGVETLIDQKRLVEGAAWMLDVVVTRWCVDSGRRFPGQRRGDALLRLLAELGEGDALLVADMAALAWDEEAASLVAGELALLGVELGLARDILGLTSRRSPEMPWQRPAPPLVLAGRARLECVG